MRATYPDQHRLCRSLLREIVQVVVEQTVQRRQLVARRTVELLPTVADVSVLDVSPEDVKAAILLFYSLLDEQQRRLYAALESLKLGRGGDRQLFPAGVEDSIDLRRRARDDDRPVHKILCGLAKCMREWQLATLNSQCRF